jgi:hypothetical protein
MNENPYKSPERGGGNHHRNGEIRWNWLAFVMAVNGFLFMASAAAAAAIYLRGGSDEIDAFDLCLVVGIYVCPLICLVAGVVWMAGRTQ